MTVPGSSTWSEQARTPNIERFLDLVSPKMDELEELLRSNFASKIGTINQVGEHILQGGGKRLRPMLLLLTSQMLDYRGTKDVRYAAVVEFLHTATLVHDDIIDEADVRRGRTSINFQWGDQLTVLVGDYLFMHGMEMALAEGNIEVLSLLSRVTIRMIEGEILGLEQNGRADISLDDYFEIIGRKTAGLFGATSRIPGYLVNVAEAEATALFDYGFNLGVCFQIIDDILDFTSTTETLGKPALSDLREGKVTLPLILALQGATDSERHTIERIASQKSFGSTDPAEITGIVNRYDAIERSRDTARQYAERARTALHRFRPSAARDALEFALDFVQQRDR